MNPYQKMFLDSRYVIILNPLDLLLSHAHSTEQFVPELSHMMVLVAMRTAIEEP